jgi:tetratricopeptide (TPR) repeat protein
LYERLAEQPNIDALERALLLQQAGISYLLRQTNPRLRQFALQTVRAADDFHAANQLLHALSAYRAAHSVYESKQWNGVDDYLHFKIARLAFTLGKQDMAMKFMNSLLESNNQSPELQNSCLREFLYIFSVRCCFLLSFPCHKL